MSKHNIHRTLKGKWILTSSGLINLNALSGIVNGVFDNWEGKEEEEDDYTDYYYIKFIPMGNNVDGENEKAYTFATYNRNEQDQWVADLETLYNILDE